MDIHLFVFLQQMDNSAWISHGHFKPGRDFIPCFSSVSPSVPKLGRFQKIEAINNTLFETGNMEFTTPMS